MRILLATAVAVALAGGPAHADDPTTDEPKATLYAFFATWCVPCRVELPHVQRLYETYADRGLKVVLVSEDDPSSAEAIPGFLARFDVTAPWELDNESELIERFNPAASVPFTVILDGNGKRVYTHAGYEPGDEELMEQAIVDALAAGAGGEAEQQSRVQVRTTTQGLGVWRSSRFEADPDMDGLLRAAVGRLDISGDAGNYSAYVRVDGAIVTDEFSDDENDARLERARASATFGPVSIHGGDDYAQFGHGVGLSLRKVDPLGVDTSIRGARVDVDYQDVEVTALAGWTNPQNLDPIELRVVDDVNDFIGGGQAKVAIGERSWVGPYAVYAEAEEAAADGSDVQWTTAGAAGAIDVGAFRFAADAAGGARTGMALEDETAWALYTSSQYTRGPVTALIDTKAYRHWALGRSDRSLLYHEPPTLEREDQEVPSNDNAIGARTRIEYRLPWDATVFGNALGYLYTQDETDPLDGGDLAMHGYLGGEKRFGDDGSIGVQAGYRHEREDDGSDKLTLFHADLDVAWRLPRKLAMTLKWNHREETKFLFNPLEFRRGIGVLGLARTGWGALSLIYSYSTEVKNGTTPTHYPAGELLVNFDHILPMMPPGSSMRLFVGQLTGGRICVSGACRDVPPFEGVRLDLTLRL
jgi:thiol-disulfide isomerase/thioredoxin